LHILVAVASGGIWNISFWCVSKEKCSWISVDTYFSTQIRAQFDTISELYVN
jgi:hypothetical protein